MSTKMEKVLELKGQGFNCAQVVIGAFCEQYGIDMTTAMKFAASFGGGVRSGELCGAISGAVMVIGLKYGQYLPNDSASKENCGVVTAKFIEEYKKRNKALRCIDIMGYDQRDKALAEKNIEIKKVVCPNAIKTAVEILEDMGF